MKYVDLHTHMGGGTAANVLYEIVMRRGMNIKSVSKNYYEFADLIHGKHDKDIDHKKYLKKFDLVEDIQSSTFAVKSSVRDMIMGSFLNDDVDLIEIRFNPMFRNKSGFYDLDRIIESACVEMKKITGMFPVKAGIIICTDWRFTSDKSIMLAEKAVKYKNMGVVGFDIAGPYVKTMNIDDHVYALNMARKGGLGICIHAGEINGACEMDKIMNKFIPDRFGHGIHITEDNGLMKLAAEYDIMFEVCPSSELKTQAIRSLSQLADILHTFDDYGVSYCMNTDGKVFLNTNIKREYDIIGAEMGWDNNRIKELNNGAKEHSFINFMD